MKLYNLARGTKFRLLEESKVPPDALPPDEDPNTVYTTAGVDGMYCKVDGPDGRTYFQCWTDVEAVE